MLNIRVAVTPIIPVIKDHLLIDKKVLAVFSEFPLPILSLVIYMVSSIINKKSEITQRKQSKITSFVQEAFSGIKQLPLEAKFGVYTAYVYYKRLLKKLSCTPSGEILNTRIRVSNPVKISLLAKSFVVYKLNLL